MSRLVQYIVVRQDLMKTLGWSVGAIVAQTCHACIAVTHLFRDDIHMQDYLTDLDNMHKVVLQVPDENSLRHLTSVLEENNINHKFWIEQPENIPTCVVVKPYPKDEIKMHFKNLQLFK